jgi:hypothetical protein
MHFSFKKAFPYGLKLLGASLQMQGKAALSVYQNAFVLMPNDAEA